MLDDTPEHPLLLRRQRPPFEYMFLPFLAILCQRRGFLALFEASSFILEPV